MRRSVKLVAFNEPLELVEEPIPEPPAAGAVVKVMYAGMCHTDIHVWANGFSLGGGKYFRYSERPGFTLPIIMGHETSGTVYSLGRDADSGEVRVGDNVVVYPWVGCENCRACTTGNANYCKGPLKYIGPVVDGGYSEYVCVPHPRYLVKVPAALPMDTAAVLACGGLTAYNGITTILPTVERLANFRDCTLLIVGPGGLGLWAVKLAKHILPRGTKVVCADVDAAKLKIAKENGCDDIVLWDRGADVATTVAATRVVCPDGVDAAIDFVNSSRTFDNIQGCLEKCGVHAVVGLFGGGGTVPLPTFALQQKQVVGVHVGGLHQFRELLALVADKQIPSPPLEHHPLEQTWDVLQALNAGNVEGRAVFHMNKS